MLSDKRIGEIATIMVIMISNREYPRPCPLGINIEQFVEEPSMHALSRAFGLSREEAEEFVSIYISLNTTSESQRPEDNKDYKLKSKSDLEQKEKDSELLGVIAIKFLQKKVFLEGMRVSPSNAKEIIKSSSGKLGITILEYAKFEAYILKYFHDQVMKEINNLIIFESGKQIVENSEIYK